MFKTIERLYNQNKNIDIVTNAVKKGWITPEQFGMITGMEYVG